MSRSRTIAVIGLGYVGLPVATAFGRAGFKVIGFDVNAERIAELRNGTDRTREVSAEDIGASGITFTEHHERSARGGFLHRDGADADRSRPRPGPVDAARRVANGRRARSSAATSSYTNRPYILERQKTPVFQCWSKRRD